MPTSFELYANYPNPFSTRTTIRFDVAEEGKVSLEVFNVMGQRVAALVNGVKRPGSYAESFEADQVSSGIYFVRFETDHVVMTKRMIVVK